MSYAKLCFVVLISCVYGRSKEVCFSVNLDLDDVGENAISFQDSFCTIGMSDRRVRDEYITASSSYDNAHGPHAARLDNKRSLNGNAPNRGSWSAGQSEVGEWIQVYMPRPTRLTGVITQGRPAVDYDQWVTSFKISYGNFPDQLQVMRDDSGVEMIFEGNSDMDSYSNNKFPRPVVARYVRLLPQTWHKYISLRMEFLTC